MHTITPFSSRMRPRASIAKNSKYTAETLEYDPKNYFYDQFEHS